LTHANFATEQILARSPADYDKDYKQMSAEDAARPCKADTSNSVEFLTSKKSAHGGFRHQFDELLGSMGVAAVGAEAMKGRYYKVEDKPGREAHNTIGTMVVSAMHRSGLLSQFTLQQVQALWVLTCVGGELGWYVVQFCVCVRSYCIKMLRVREAGVLSAKKW